LSADSAAVGPGEILADRFELERLAGSGGMGQIWRARDRQSGEAVAIKTLQRPDEHLIARFQREARLLAALQHPAVVRHLAHGTTGDGVQYLAMEWLEGEDLSARIARGPLGIDEALALAVRVAEALALVHARGVIHRDLKPANLFLPGGRLDQVTIIDFGIARDAAATLGLTEPGAALGSPAYMAPEQVRGDPDVDARADLYGLGCILFECLTGQPPFVAAHPVAVLAKVLFEDAPRPGALRAEVPAELDLLVARFIAKERDDRPADAAAAARALRGHGRGRGRAPGEPASASMPPPAAPALTRSERRLVSVVLARAAPRSPDAPARCTFGARSTMDARASAERGPADAPSIADLRRAAQAYGGRLEPLRDGAVIAVIAGAATPTDLAARAARCGLSLRELLPGARIAVATGWDAASDEQPIGPVIDRAGALLAEGGAALAAPAAVLLDPTTAGLLGPRFEIARAEAAQALVAERDPLEEARALLGRPTPFVGRDRELRALTDLWDECTAEPCARAALVTAAAGMGKSRLRLELARRIRARGEPLEIWTAQGDPARAGSPLGLLGQVVRRAARLVEGEPLDLRRDRLAARVAQHVDGALRERVTGFLGELAGAPFPDDDNVQLRAARKDPLLHGDQIRRAWIDLLEAECGAHPVLLVLEDLHWGDLPTVECIDAALRALRERPLLVLALARPEVRETFPDLWAERDLTEIRLGALPRRACEQMVRSALGEDAPEERVAEIVRRGAGHAFFVEELVRAAAEGRDACEAPETVLAMVQARIEALDAEARRALRAASVLGEVLWQGAVARLLGLDREDRALGAILADLERREWIVRQPAPRFIGEAEYVFRHDLVREAAYGMLTEADRRLGHHLAGLWLEEAGERDALVLAEHHERGGAIAAAARCYERAAEQALEASDLDGVLVRVDRALACEPGPEAAGRLHALAATAHDWRGAFAKAERAAKDALALSPRGSKARHAALAMLAWASGGLGKVGQLEGLASELLLGEPGAASDRDLVLARCTASTWLWDLGRHAAARALEAVNDALSPEALEPGLLGHVCAARSYGAWFARRIEPALRLAESAGSAYERGGDLRNASWMRSIIGALLVQLGAYPQAESVFAEARKAAEELGVSYVVHETKVNLARIHVARGQSAAARALAAEVIDEAAGASNIRQASMARVVLARALLALGEIQRARDESERAARDGEAYPSLRAAAEATLTRILLFQRRPAEALAPARRAMDILEHLGVLDVDDAFVRLTWAQALNAAGDRDAACSAIAAARAQLQAEAEALEPPEPRRAFFEEVPEHARILALAEAWGA